MGVLLEGPHINLPVRVDPLDQAQLRRREGVLINDRLGCLEEVMVVAVVKRLIDVYQVSKGQSTVHMEPIGEGHF